ncbi:Rv0909 family putative TA system antitoxin [Streptomyces sp. NBC_00249]|uniref:Rv0909 family putative TA system antitoxin n=1 Tax=Streptomyces sp. NBC_00249 TaxID=2975690 RepID=UPI002255E1BC|nr:Rv0909 family putative TA system antitoxin [Streptomyces sp. NBC_00249]MCX5198911.1 Rv0909 family putative TA system antitoxin [Streptomyces sp. NBC_00249]
MGIFDKFRDQAKAKGKGISDNLEQEANEKTGNKYADQIDKAQQQAEERLGIDDDPNK